MKNFSFTALLASVALSTAATPALANDYITGYVGYYNVMDDEQNATQFGAEYRFNPYVYGIRPIVGASITTDGSAYGYAGLNWDIDLIPNELYVIPNFAVGAYSEGDGKDLGGALEFRSGIEVAYQFPNEHRLGVALNHLSNASIYDKNPGTEIVLINYSIPTKSLF